MKSTALLLSLVAAASVNAQESSQDLFTGKTACATSCYSSANSAAGCAVTDVACVCGPSASDIVLTAIACLIATCTGLNVAAVQSAGTAACEAAAAGQTGLLVSSITRPPTSTTRSPTSTTRPPTLRTTTSASSTSPPADGERGGSTPSSSALSSGASIGIGVGIALGVVALVGVAWLLFKRRRRKAKKSAGAGGQPETMAVEVDAKDTEYRPELEARQVPVEIGGDHHGQRPPPPPPPVELDGGGQRG